MPELTLRPASPLSQLVLLSALAGSDLIQAGCVGVGWPGGETLGLANSAFNCFVGDS